MVMLVGQSYIRAGATALLYASLTASHSIAQHCAARYSIMQHEDSIAQHWDKTNNTGTRHILRDRTHSICNTPKVWWGGYERRA
jgi:hypothetical protein